MKMKFIMKSILLALATVAMMSMLAACGEEPSELDNNIDDPNINVEQPDDENSDSDIDPALQEEIDARNTAMMDSYNKALEKNSETKMWLNIPNTNINYPVMYRPADTKNSYYMNKTITHQNDVDGALFADFRCNFGNDQMSKNTVIYGHNWENISAEPRKGDVEATDTMFAQLMSYHYLDFAQENPYIHTIVDGKHMTFKVFATFYTDIEFDYIDPNPISAEFVPLTDEAKSRSEHVFDVEITEEDKIITLSTCTRRFDIGNKQRFVVMARALRDGETEVDEVEVTKNENPKLPKGVA